MVRLRLGRVALLSGSLLWVAVANIGPLIEMARISLLDTYPGAPGSESRLSLDHYTSFLTTAAYYRPFLRSLAYAAATTVVALFVSYPLAYAIAIRTPRRLRIRRLLLLVAPFWTSEIVRLFAIMLLLANRGAVNAVLGWVGIEASLPLLYSPISVVLGMLYVTQLAMLLPIYAALERLPRELVDAAATLGAGPWQRLLRVTLPLTREGIVSGCALVFLISLGSLAAPALLGGAETTVFAMTINSLFASSAGRWPVGCAFGLILLVGGLTVAGLLIWLVSPRVFNFGEQSRA